MSPIYFLLLLFFLNVLVLLTRHTNKERLLLTIDLAGLVAAASLAFIDVIEGWKWTSQLLSHGMLARYFVLIVALYFVTTLVLVIKERAQLTPQYYAGMIGQAVIAFALVGAESLLLIWILVPLWYWQSYWFYSLNTIGSRSLVSNTYLLHILVVIVATSLAIVGLGTTLNTFSISELSRIASGMTALHMKTFGSMWVLIFVVVALHSVLSLFSTQRQLMAAVHWSALLHNHYLSILVGALFLYRWVFSGALKWEVATQSLSSPFSNLGLFLAIYSALAALLLFWRIITEPGFALRLGAWLELSLLWPFVAMATLSGHAIKIAFALPLLIALALSLVVYLARYQGGLTSESLMALFASRKASTRETLLLTLILLSMLGPGFSLIHIDLLDAVFNSMRYQERFIWGQIGLTPEQIVAGFLYLTASFTFWIQLIRIMRRRRAEEELLQGKAALPFWIYIWALSLIFVGIYPRPLYNYLDHLLNAIVI
jgi:hypothetical protein